MRTARSRISGEKRFDFLFMAPSSQSLEPPQNPGRFTTAAAIKSCLKQGGRLLYSVPSKRLDVVASNRDANGRLFIPDQASRLNSLFFDLGFMEIQSWANSDSMGRDAVEWMSVLLELQRA
jgi:hypothetical protein